jgi:putative hemolysin
VCGDGVDDIRGILDVRDYFRLPSTDRQTVLSQAVRPAWFVPESVTANVLVQNMRSGGHSFAVVLDEYGGVYGIVTMNDLVQQLVGDLGDDGIPAGADEEITAQPDGSWLVEGTAPLDKLEKALNVDFDEEADDYDTFGGLVFGTQGRVLADGETVTVQLQGLEVQVLLVENRHMRLAKVKLLPQQ